MHVITHHKLYIQLHTFCKVLRGPGLFVKFKALREGLVLVKVVQGENHRPFLPLCEVANLQLMQQNVSIN